MLYVKYKFNITQLFLQICKYLLGLHGCDITLFMNMSEFYIRFVFYDKRMPTTSAFNMALFVASAATPRGKAWLVVSLFSARWRA